MFTTVTKAKDLLIFGKPHKLIDAVINSAFYIITVLKSFKMDYSALQVHNRFHKVAAKPIICFKHCAYRR